MVIALTGIVLVVVAHFIVQPIQAYLSVSARARLVDSADGALIRMVRDLHLALPNSVRVSADGRSLELIPTAGAARYATAGSNALAFGSPVTSFDLVGPPLTLAAQQQLVFYNLGSGITGSDAYAPNGSASEQASSNRRQSTNAAGPASTIGLASLAGLPVVDLAPPYRVTAVGEPVSYRCDLSAGTLTRYTGYGFLAVQPDPPSGGSSAVLADGVSACRFSADALAIAARAGLITLQISLSTLTSGGNENVTLSQAVHVNNLP